MTIFRGLVSTLDIRDDGWVEVILTAVHAGNATSTFYIKDLDGDITVAHKRLGQLSLLRDAITRVLPVEIDYVVDKEQGNLIQEVMIHPRPSIEGRDIGSPIQGVVIGVSITEVGPSGSTPYLDQPDLAGITLLQDDGTITQLLLDLQREEALTMHAMLALLQMAHKTRRPVIVLTSSGKTANQPGGSFGTSVNSFNNSAANYNPSNYIESCEWVTVVEETLDYGYAFVERLGQRYESFDSTEAGLLSHVKVVYTTAPGQTPEGDISDNGLFKPATQIAYVPDDSPLLCLLKLALEKRLQIKLGLLKDQIHEVEIVSHLGSASRPIWICINQSVTQQESNGNCDNTPTITTPTNVSLNNIAMNLDWKAQGYFNEGIWRFQVTTGTKYELTIDGKAPCCGQSSSHCCCVKDNSTPPLIHAYLKGIHTVDLTLHSQTAAEPFALQIYRIR